MQKITICVSVCSKIEIGVSVIIRGKATFCQRGETSRAIFDADETQAIFQFIVIYFRFLLPVLYLTILIGFIL